MEIGLWLVGSCLVVLILIVVIMRNMAPPIQAPRAPVVGNPFEVVDYLPGCQGCGNNRQWAIASQIGDLQLNQTYHDRHAAEGLTELLNAVYHVGHANGCSE